MRSLQTAGGAGPWALGVSLLPVYIADGGGGEEDEGLRAAEVGMMDSRWWT